jgi:hypothetical protein
MFSFSPPILQSLTAPPSILQMGDAFTRSGAIIGSDVEFPVPGVSYGNYLTGGGAGSIIGGAARGVTALGVCARLTGLSLSGTYTINARIDPRRYLSIITRASSSAAQTEGIWVSFVAASNILRIESVNASFVDSTLISVPLVFPAAFFDCVINVTPTSVQVIIPSLGANITATTALYAANTAVGLYFDGIVGNPDLVDSWSIPL